MTQEKIERYHLSMKNVVKLDTYNFPWELDHTFDAFVTYYNHERYHELLHNMKLADVYFGRVEEIETRRDRIKKRTMAERRLHNRQATPAVIARGGDPSLIFHR